MCALHTAQGEVCSVRYSFFSVLRKIYNFQCALKICSLECSIKIGLRNNGILCCTMQHVSSAYKFALFHYYKENIFFCIFIDLVFYFPA